MTLQDKAAWLDAYLDNLPDTIRPDPDDRRFKKAAAAAWEQGWTGHQAAHVITRRNYQDKTNPPLVAIMELERLGTHPPASSSRRGKKTKPHNCIACPPTATWIDDTGTRHLGCPEPITTLTPPDWVAERFQLLNQLIATPGMTEDQREDAMHALIDKQRTSTP